MKNKTSECVSRRSSRAPSKRKIGSAQPMPSKGQTSIPSPDPNASDVLEAALQDVINIHEINKNLGQSIIVTNEDKVRLVLNEHWRPVKRRRWNRPRDIFITLILVVFTFTTSTFHDSLSIKKDIWKALFTYFAVWCAYVFIRSLWFAINNEPPSVDDLIAQIKSGTAIEKASKTKFSEDSSNPHPVVGGGAQNPSAISTTTVIRNL